MKRKLITSPAVQASSAILLLGLLVTFIIASYIEAGNQKRIEAEIQKMAANVMQSIKSRLDDYQQGLLEARSLAFTLGKENLNRQRFRNYYRARDIRAEFPGANGFGFIRRIPFAQKDKFVSNIRALDWPDFAVKTLGKQPLYHYVVHYIEPLTSNRQLIGLDIASDPQHLNTLMMAIRNDDVRLTGPITLEHQTGSVFQAFLMLMPIYDKGAAPARLKDREAQAFGLSFSPLTMSAVFSDLTAKQTSIQLYDITQPNDPILFYDSSHNIDIRARQVVTRHTVYGRVWESHIGVSAEFIDAIPIISTLHSSLFGVLVSLLIAGLTGTIFANRQHHLDIITHQAKLASIVESSADGIIGETLTGIITSWNYGAEKILGYTSDEAIGLSIRDLIIPDELQGEETAILKKIRSGQAVPHIETIRKNKIGNRLAVSVTVSPVYGKNDSVIGASMTLRDISQHKENEAQLYQLNNNLEVEVKNRTRELADLNLLLSNVLSAASEMGIIATDTTGNITLFNAGAERMLGYQAKEVIGTYTPLQFYLSQELNARAKELSHLYDRPIEGIDIFTLKPELEGSERRDWTWVHKNGLNFPVSLVVTRMLDKEQKKTIGYLNIATNITENYRVNTKLMTARDHLLMAAGVAELGIWSWNIDDNSLEWSDKMFSLYELPTSLKSEGLLYHHWLNCLHADDIQDVTENMRVAMDGKGQYDIIFRIVLPSGKLRYIEESAYVKKDEQGNAIKVIGINRDVTTDRELQISLRSAKEEADAANEAKSAFLANMSHEIRTPMNAILGLLLLLQKTDLSAQQADYLEKTQVAADTLLKLLNDILDYSKMDVNKLELDLHEFELEDMLQDLAAILSGHNKEENVELIFDIDTSLPQRLIGDRMRLLQVLINLTNNALKFTLEGQVVLAISKQFATSNRITLRIEIIDTGIGITEEQQKKIFDGFSQAEASTSRQFGGSGLGLAICKSLVSLMGSELKLSSTLYEGSCFWFDLSLDIVQSEQHEEKQTKNHLLLNAHQELNLLILEYNSGKTNILERLFASVGYNTVIVDTEQGAFAAINNAIIKERPFDIVLLDWQKFDMKYLAFLDNLSETRGLSSFTIVIMVTASQYEQFNRISHFDTSVVQFVIKPITSLQLLQAIVSTADGESPQIQKIPTTAPTNNRLAGIRVLIVEDNAINRQVAVELLNLEGALTTVVNGGQEGVHAVLHKAQRFDVVLMDMQMPDVDGLQATKQIRADKRFTDLPIIAMTANVSTADKEACLSAGMNAHLSKPLDINLMVATINRFTERQADLFKGSDALAPKDIIKLTSQNISQNNGLVDSSSSVLKRFGDNTNLYKKLLASFESTLEDTFKTLHKQIKNQNKDLLLNHLHGLKGSAGTLGARQFFTTIEKIEATLKHTSHDQQIHIDFVDLDALHHLLMQELAVLKATIDTKEEKKTTQSHAISYDPATLKGQLAVLYDLLIAGNLDVIDKAQTLNQTDFSDEEQQQAIGELVKLIDELDFSAALVLLEKIRAGL
ncbi:PAS domain S-box protein [Marinomonas agarivorans]|nr:PAS domain S-box protein [Marinomonas agarivorans]